MRARQGRLLFLGRNVLISKAVSPVVGPLVVQGHVV